MSDVPLPLGDPTLDLPFAHGGPVLSGVLRSRPEDFVVVEDLGYQASGSGEHVLLTVRKRERNTQDVARQLARHAGVAPVAVGYAGLKDRNAVTTQGFSVQLPGREAPDWGGLEDASLQVLSAQRHDRKIRRGSLRGNRFEIRVDRVEGDHAAADERLERIRACGVPNYFGTQRFGRQGQNLRGFADLLARRGRRLNRDQRGLVLSAARSHLFNLVLARRVSAGSWDQVVAGDVLSLAGSQRQFRHDPADPTIEARLAALDLHPTGPLCGQSSRALMPDMEALAVEEAVLAPWSGWIDGLAGQRVEADRRALRLAVTDLDWTWEPDALRLAFGLTAGGYATAVLRELVSGTA